MSDLIIYNDKMNKVVSFPSLLIMVLFIQVGMVSFNSFLGVDSPLVESAVSNDDVTMDDAFSHFYEQEIAENLKFQFFLFSWSFVS